MIKTTDIVIREAEGSDASRLLDYLMKIGKESQNLVIDEKGLPSTLEQEIAFLEARKGASNSIMLLACCNDQIVGTTNCEASLRSRICHGGEIGISVAKDFWGMGIGTKLLDALITWAKRQETGLSKLSLEVRQDNERALNLYRKFGFVEEGKISRLLRIDGVYYDGVRMVLLWS
ncbi:GNAT family protein [uncultured Sphaerochaeta sp.]|uniref:GNAT family N-acetyltransferase n=1 Tax=uncultured Sphaerochaeta sp. TaxID=886478 RepID=UPI002A0A64D4|nr:GNAT family protein [uncultured Sphaerochaeta sp.]